MIDLGRQIESIDFLKSIADFSVKHGYNTIVLYLENAVRTSKNQFVNKNESYSMEELKEIVSYMEKIGLDIIPAFETLGHLEKFLKYDELGNFAETQDCSKEGRGWWYPKYVRGQNGCVSDNELFEFMSDYIKEVTSVFHSKYIHMGLDEVFDFAICKKCQERIALGETKLEMFYKYILKCHDLTTSLGKRMMMWDDFFEYYDCVERLPKDIIMCTWNYYYIQDELPGKWTNRIRRDNFRIYDSLGMDYIICTYAHNSGSTYNIDSLTEYGSKYKPMGAMMTTWERSNCFYQGLLPSIAYGGELWNNKVSSEEDIIGLYSSLLDGERELAELILSLNIPIFMGSYTNISKMVENDYFFKEAMRKEYKYVLKNVRPYLDKLSGLSKDIITDMYDYILDNYQMLKIAKIGSDLFDMYEGRPFDSSIDKQLDEVIKDYEFMKSNGDYLWKKYRNGILSTDNYYEEDSLGKIEFAKKLKKDIVKSNDTGIFYLELMMHDAYSTVKGALKVKYHGDKEETIIHQGGIKPTTACLELGSTYGFRLKIENRKIDYAIFEVYGEGALWPLHMKYMENGVKHPVTKVEELYGNTEHLENILKNNSEFACMGYNSGIDHLNDATLWKKRSGIKLYF